MIKAIVFDFFGVVHTDPFHAWLKNHGTTRNEEPGRVSEQFDTGMIAEDKFYERLGALTGQTDRGVRAEFAASAAFDEQVVAFITDLKRQYEIGLLSNSGSSFLRGILKAGELEPLFDAIVISGEEGIAKPDSRLFTLMLDRLGAVANEVIFIDDQPKNTAAATAVGMQAIQYQNLSQLKRDITKIL